MEQKTRTPEEILRNFQEEYWNTASVENKKTVEYMPDSVIISAIKAYNAQFQHADIKVMEKFSINNISPKGCYDLEFHDEIYNAFCDYYHDDGSNDEKLRKSLKELLVKFLKANSSPATGIREALKELVDALNATQFPMNLWERAEFDMIVKLRDAKEKAESVLNQKTK